MSEPIRIYRRFYRISLNNGTETYVPINPFELIVDVHNITNNNVVVESNLIPVEENLGLWYIELTSNLYNSNDIFEINWKVNYTEQAPLKIQYTRFKFREQQSTVGSRLSVELLNNNPLEIFVPKNPIYISIE